MGNIQYIYIVSATEVDSYKDFTKVYDIALHIFRFIPFSFPFRVLVTPVQPRTKVKLDFSWPVVWINRNAAFSYKSFVLLMGMSKVSGTSSMLMCCR